MTNVMVDLETLGTGPNAAIVSIGACVFHPDRTGKDRVGDTFYAVVDEGTGGDIDRATVAWWMQQSSEARSVFNHPDPRSLRDALYGLQVFLRGVTDGGVTSPLIWGNGANFDNVILRSAYKRANIEAPWMFWNDRCFRTLKSLPVPIPKIERQGVHHNALDDAVYQAQVACAILNAISGDKQ